MRCGPAPSPEAEPSRPSGRSVAPAPRLRGYASVFEIFQQQNIYAISFVRTLCSYRSVTGVVVSAAVSSPLGTLAPVPKAVPRGRASPGPSVALTSHVRPRTYPLDLSVCGNNPGPCSLKDERGPLAGFSLRGGPYQQLQRFGEAPLTAGRAHLPFWVIRSVFPSIFCAVAEMARRSDPCPARVVSATRRRAHHSQGVRSPTPATCARRVSPPSGQSPPIASTGHRPRSRCCGILLAACFPRWRQESLSLAQTQKITVAASAIAAKSVGGLRS